MKEKILRKAKEDRSFRQACIKKLSSLHFSGFRKPFAVNVLKYSDDPIPDNPADLTYKIEGTIRGEDAIVPFSIVWNVDRGRYETNHIFFGSPLKKVPESSIEGEIVMGCAYSFVKKVLRG
jgi:hypothetical protein